MLVKKWKLHHSDWINQRTYVQSKQLVYFQTENSSWPTRSFCSLFTKRYTPQKVFTSNNMPIRSFFPSNYIDCQLFVARTKLKYNVRYIYSTTARPEQTQYQPFLKSDKQGNMTTIHQQTCATLCSTQGSSRTARARFDARANLTELNADNAWLGRWLFEKSGRSLARDSSCSLLSNKVVSATFISGLGLQLSSSTWKKWWQKKNRIKLISAARRVKKTGYWRPKHK